MDTHSTDGSARFDSTRRHLVFWIVILFAASLFCPKSDARNPEVSRIELLNEPPPVKVKIPATPGCVFGDRFYELEQTWHPELLQSGVLYCVLCQCLPKIDKGVLSSKGHVTCRDIKSECPEVTCDNPVLLPEQCCKTCPGQDLPVFRGFPPSGQLAEWTDGPSSADSQTASLDTQQDFIAVLTGLAAPGTVATSAVGVGYFSLFQGTLVYTIHLDGVKKPRSLKIVDNHHTVFHSRKVDSRKKSQTVCGSINWPDVYTGFLRRRRLYVQIETKAHKDGEIRGEIQPKHSLSSDTFTSLLAPADRSGSGGVLLATPTNDANEITFTALIQITEITTEDNDLPSVTFKVINKKKTFHTYVAHLSNKDNLTTITWSWNDVKRRVQMFLAAEKLSVQVTTASGEGLVGKLTVRHTCNSYWAIMRRSGQSTQAGGAAGMVLIQNQKKGSIRYKATISGLQEKISKITMTSTDSEKKPFCEISGNSLKYNKHSLQYTGKGKCKRLPMMAISSLLQHHVTIAVQTTADQGSVLQGSITEIQYNGNVVEVSGDPVLLTNRKLPLPTIPHSVGLAWLTLSELCQLHYQVKVTGSHVADKSLQLLITDDQQMTRSLILDRLTDDMIKGSEPELPDYLYLALHQGHARLVVYDKNKNSSELSGQIRIKNRCSRQQARDKAIQTKKLPVLDPDTVQDDPAAVSPTQKECLYQGKFYKDMDTWPRKPGSCTICSCKRGTVECHEVLCPNLTDCKNAVNIKGECCAQCQDAVDTSVSCYYPGDKRKHFRGAIWHPYVPPFGFMPCAVCQCSEKTGDVNCTRVMCPELTCPEDKAFLRSKSDCCKVCPEMAQSDRDDEGACVFRGRKHYNGTSWHPNVQPFGLMKCVTCSCLNGQASCIREKCPQLNCDRRRRIIMPNDCCPICRKHVPRRGYAKYRRKKH